MSEPQPQSPAPTRFEGLAPILRVGSVAASVAYYVDALGFTVGWEYAGQIASVSRGPCDLFLAEGDQGHPGSWVWIGVEDAAALFAEYRARGARIRQPPTSFPWALEMQVEDLDGNVLRMGSDSVEGQPFGPWLDMRGDLWLAQPGGGWARTPPADAESAA